MTATIIENYLDTDVLDALDFEHQVPCGYDCDKDAVWKVKLKCCGRVCFVCDQHMDNLLDMQNSGVLFFDPDPKCNKHYIPSPIAFYERI